MQVVFALLTAYLLGSIPSAVWLGKLLKGIDIREHGSGNAGATNMIRVLGTWIGIVVLIVDMLKGFLAVRVAAQFPTAATFMGDQDFLMVIMAMMAVLGHIFPVLAGFKGGKGVATFLGTALGLFPLTFACTIGVFLIIFSLTRLVSLGSIISGLSMPLLAGLVFNETPVMIAYAIGVALVIPITHRRNIVRLLSGTEKKLSLKRKKVVLEDIQEPGSTDALSEADH